jgi:hypothetical protein
MLKFVNKLRMHNNTILFKEDIFQPKDDTMFLDYGIFPNNTHKPYDDYYNVRMKIKPKEMGIEKISTCQMYGCSGIDRESFRYGHDIVKEFKISKEINNDLLNMCKLLVIDNKELIKDKHATAIALGKKLSLHNEIKAYMCYLEEINKQHYEVSYIELLRAIEKNKQNTDAKDKYIKDKIYQIVDTNTHIGLLIYEKLLIKLDEILYDDLKDLKVKTLRDLYK